MRPNKKSDVCVVTTSLSSTNKNARIRAGEVLLLPYYYYYYYYVLLCLFVVIVSLLPALRVLPSKKTPISEKIDVVPSPLENLEAFEFFRVIVAEEEFLAFLDAFDDCFEIFGTNRAGWVHEVVRELTQRCDGFFVAVFWEVYGDESFICFAPLVGSFL